MSGTLLATATGALGTQMVTDDGTLAFNCTGMISNVISGPMSSFLTVSTSGLLDLTGTYGFNGSTTVVLRDLECSGLGYMEPNTVDATATLLFQNAANLTISNIQGAGTVMINGGSVTLTGGNYAGTTSIENYGTLYDGTSSATGLLGSQTVNVGVTGYGGGSLVVTDGTLSGQTVNMAGGNLVFNCGGTCSAAIVGTGNVTVGDSAIVTLSGNNNYVGTTTISSACGLTLDGGAAYSGNFTDNGVLGFNTANSISVTGTSPDPEV